MIEFVRGAAPLLTNSIGAVGEGISKYVHYQSVFADDVLKFKHMMSALKPFNHVFIKAARDLTKHPAVVGFETDAALRRFHRTNASINQVAELEIANILKNANLEIVYAERLGKLVYEYRLPTGYGARFEIDGGRMIGFVDPNLGAK